jgi:indole-3-glycerol phosphate synthase/phosphoribosylanthranilate isomerase
MALDDIVAHKRGEVAARRAAHPLEQLETGLGRSDRSLDDALRRPRTGFILECKGASPSQGVIRPEVDLAEVAAAYEPHADAISVLTDERFFGGSLERMRTLRRMVHVPILCKDVVVDPYQVIEARRHGADAILLMLSVLDDAAYTACLTAATDLGMDVVTEVHTDEELARAMALDARIIGINNRNLRTLSLDPGVTERLAPRITGNRVILSESGITDHHAVRRLRGLVDGFLVGTALMREPDLAQAARALIYGVTKVCGLTRAEDAATAHALGATHGGMIFAEESPRRVDLNRAAELRRAAPLRWVGVFVNAEPETIVQGEEPPEVVAALRTRFAGHREVWKAVRVRDEVPRVDQTGADRLVLDGHDDRMRGGTGRRFNWALLTGYPDLGRVLLSGGLTPEAVPSAEAIGTWGLDVNSGVERAPGRKDPVLVAAFLDARRGIGRRATSPR